MRHRLYCLLPDIDSARRAFDDIDDRPCACAAGRAHRETDDGGSSRNALRGGGTWRADLPMNRLFP